MQLKTSKKLVVALAEPESTSASACPSQPPSGTQWSRPSILASHKLISTVRPLILASQHGVIVRDTAHLALAISSSSMLPVVPAEELELIFSSSFSLSSAERMGAPCRFSSNSMTSGSTASNLDL
jgi:hypothetical protein